MRPLNDQPARRPRPHPPRRGFTLMEAAMTTVIIGLGVVALVELLATGTMTNIRGSETTTGMNLARNLRERTIQAPYDSLVGLNGSVFKPPIDSRGIELSGLDEWEQRLTVQAVDPRRVTANVSSPTPQALRLTARIFRNGREVCDLNWYCFDGTP